MVFTNDVWSDDELPVRIVLEHIWDENLLIRQPTASCHEAILAIEESGNDRKFLALLLDGEHAVEASVATDSDIMDANLGEQFARALILHEESCEAFQHFAVLSAVPAEENLVGTEDGADAIDRNIAVAQDMEVVIPELILDEERHFRSYGAQESACIVWSVERKIADDVSPLVILSHLIARWREEREEDFEFRTFLSESLDNGASLFKFTQRGGMKPYVSSVRVHFLPNRTYGFLLALPHHLHLLVEEAGNGDACKVNEYYNIIHHDFL